MSEGQDCAVNVGQNVPAPATASPRQGGACLATRAAPASLTCLSEGRSQPGQGCERGRRSGKGAAEQPPSRSQSYIPTQLQVFPQLG